MVCAVSASTKFAHAIYRPVALFFYSLAGQKVTQDA